MNSIMSSSSERPAKRVRQACEPCRRKKSRCPGEKPACSLCTRLRQTCVYAEERQDNGVARRSLSPLRSPRASRAPTNDPRLEDRLKNVEARLAEVLANQVSHMGSPSRHVSASPSISQIRVDPVRPPCDSRLPTWDTIQSVAETYLLYCDCQPLPLFHRQSFIRSLRTRDPELLFAVLALASRFSDGTIRASQIELVDGYVEASRTIISKRVFDGDVELSTIQSLCLLALVDFTDGKKRRASVHSSLAMSLAHNAGLTGETYAPVSRSQKEERRRCFWSLFLLKRLHGADFMVLDFATDENFPRYPETTGKVINHEATGNQSFSASPEPSVDQGIVAYAIQMSEIWFKVTRYAWRRSIPNELPPWSPQSEYSTILGQQMDAETRMPFTHRFAPSKFSQRSIDELNGTRDYWGPWLLIQFLYHTNLCLLNHPLLISLRLRNFKGVIPEIFLQHTSDLISTHASWIINFIDMLDSKQFIVTDPFLAHCVAIIATIYLQESFVEDMTKRREKQEHFEKCLKFIRGFGSYWPHVGRIADKLHKLSETVSSTQVASDEPIRQNRKLLIDLGQFFEILEYSSSSEIAGSARNMFGPSLSSTIPASRTEMAQTTILPEPTRVERQEFGTPSASNTPTTAVPDHSAYMNFAMTPVVTNTGAFQFSDDELAVLAENFFQQRTDDGNANWWNMGNL